MENQKVRECLREHFALTKTPFEDFAREIDDAYTRYLDNRICARKDVESFSKYRPN